jgi:glycerate kinase
LRIVVCPNAFKECLSAAGAAQAIAAGLRRADTTAQIDLAPLADGGDGTVETLVLATGGTLRTASVTGPMGDCIDAAYGVLGDGITAVIEMASASGLALVAPNRRDPRLATTRGTGELLRNALDAGYTRIIVGIGGSATNDGGAGMAQALGWRLSDDAGNALGPGGSELIRLRSIDGKNKHPRISQAEILIACDVDNPLCGPRGASRVYGPQKGATPQIVEELDAALSHFANVVSSQLRIDVLDMPGAGAAGGLGAGLVAFTGGKLSPGFTLIANACRLDQRIREADLVITGEGALDEQSANGKTPAGVAAIAKKHNVPAIALAGKLDHGFEKLYECGLSAAFSICPAPISQESAMKNAPALLADAAESAVRLFMARRPGH